MKKTLLLFITILFLSNSIGIAVAEEGLGGNNRKGKYLYRKVYKACAEAGEVDTATPPVNPSDKKRAEWKNIYENKKLEEFGCATYWEALSDKDVLDIFSYLYEYAADSPSPASCE